MTLRRTMKGNLNDLVQSVSGVVVWRIGTKSQSQPMDSTLIKGCLTVWIRVPMRWTSKRSVWRAKPYLVALL
jgi:hypothetical protein